LHAAGLSWNVLLVVSMKSLQMHIFWQQKDPTVVG
jgi:hypothetical protein